MGKTGRKNKNYSAEFKICVIMDMREHHLGYRETMRKYFPHLKENCFEFLKKWERIYLEEGAEGLMKERQGRACRASGANKGRYGYRRILTILRNKGYVINHKTVLKLMNSLNLKGKQRKNGKYHSYKGEVGKVEENLLHRDFHANKPFEKLTTDVTEFKIGDEKCTFRLCWICSTVKLYPILFLQVQTCNKLELC